MDYTHHIADSNLALSAGDFEAALKGAESALSVDKGKTEAYYCAGKALMSMGKIDEAISYFQKALKINDHDGNGFFLLGYAQAMSEKTYEALRSLTKALELNCETILKGQIYRILSMINSDNGDFNDALMNLAQAEEYGGLDLEILEQRAACYASLKDYHQTFYTLNQIKLLTPTNYYTNNDFA